MIDPRRIRFSCRLRVGLWFATTSLLPTVVAYLIVGTNTPVWHKLLLLLVPVCVAGTCGATIGVHINDPVQCASGWQALLFGGSLMLCAYVFSGLLLAAGLFIPTMPGALPQQIVGGLALALLCVVLLLPVAAPKLLLLICAMGSTAGWLLYRYPLRLATLALFHLILSCISIWWLVLHDPPSLYFPHLSGAPS